MWSIDKKVSKGDYDYAVVKNHPNATKHGYVLYHRIVMENAIGRLLKDNEIVHHRNENKKDNEISNLELMTASEHAAHHNPKGRELVVLICPTCKNKFEREKRQTHLVKKGNKRTYCSRTCRARFKAT